MERFRHSIPAWRLKFPIDFADGLQYDELSGRLADKLVLSGNQDDDPDAKENERKARRAEEMQNWDREICNAVELLAGEKGGEQYPIVPPLTLDDLQHKGFFSSDGSLMFMMRVHSNLLVG